MREGAKAHYRVKHGANEFANRRSHINGIVNFLLRAIRLVTA
ncbi:hypothetical protein [Campylobacter troglodytis]